MGQEFGDFDFCRKEAMQCDKPIGWDAEVPFPAQDLAQDGRPSSPATVTLGRRAMQIFGYQRHTDHISKS